MQFHWAILASLLALLAPVAWGAADVTEVDLKGWYTEALSRSQCAAASCVCIEAEFPMSSQPAPVSGWAVQEQSDGNVTVSTAKDFKPNHCFLDRQSTEHKDGRLHLRLNVMLYRNQVSGLTRAVLVRPEALQQSLVRIYIEPNQ